MFSTSHRGARISHPPRRFAAVTVIVIGVALGSTAIVSAAEPGPVLVVPASSAALQVAAPLPEGVKLETSGAWQLVEVGQADLVIPAQLVPAIAPDGTFSKDVLRLVANVPPRDGATGVRRFMPRPAKDQPRAAETSLELKDVDDKSLGLFDAGKPVLVYNHGVITCDKVPENDARRSRACYIHPVYGLSGEVLTEDFPRDHYHHHGIFWAWPHVGIDGQEYDLWISNNIKQKFVGWICRRTGPAAAVVAVENGWFVGEKKVMIERVWLRAYNLADDARSLDLELTWIPVDRPVTLWGAGGKSYGGLVVRFRPPSAKDGVITVPGGVTTDDLKESPLAWVDFTSNFGAPTPSGAAVFIAPDHPDYPPTWLTRHYGPLCVGWPGVKPKTFEPGKPIRLSYRIRIHKTALDAAQLQEAYDAYAAAFNAKWE